MRALVVGAGSIGRRHLGNLRALGVTELAVCEPDDARRAAAESDGVAGFASLDPALVAWRPKIGLICTPPVHHLEPALALVRSGADVFLEKPVAAVLDGLDVLANEAAAAKRLIQVGYNLRFHPVLRAVKQLLDEHAIGRVVYAHAQVGQYLPDWRPTVDYRTSYTARRELGGGILLDASHELDYLCWLLGEPTTVSCESGHGSSLEVDVEDSATVLLGYPAGAHAVVHMDFVRRGYLRTLQLVGDTGNIHADLGARTVELHRSRSDIELVPLAEGDMYRLEMEHFLASVASRRVPEIDLASGIRTLRLVELARQAATDGVRRQV